MGRGSIGGEGDMGSGPPSLENHKCNGWLEPPPPHTHTHMTKVSGSAHKDGIES